jgi:ribonucleoside-triphosphate reductase
MTPYQQFIAKSRYARYLPMELRREHWNETSARWIEYFQGKMHQRGMPIDHPIWEDLYKSINNLEVLPSMRSIMTAGEALERTNVAAYNCAYLPVDSLRSFDEAMYILLCGTGVGFSVEQHYVDQLPVVPKYIMQVDTKIIVEDSKEGWCHAFHELIDNLYRGIALGWDVSRVRPAGTPLKTFGGRASGPEPLVSLFQYTVNKFKAAAGRKLETIEAHDIMCKIGEVVVVGGVRRSAMISLGDLGDYDHANAKSGSWWEHTGERALANNSAVYHERPHIGQFMNEWTNIYNSKSGERGIFNRQASQAQAAKYGRRPYDIEYGTNPCSEIILRPYQFCNLSTIVAKPEDTMKDLSVKAVQAAIFGTMQATLTNFPYLRSIWKENTEDEALLGVSITGILGNDNLYGYGRRQSNIDHLRRVANETNIIWSSKLGINVAAAVTCVKPEGTVSQLTETKSGIHAGHAPYYIRRVRQDNKDPLTKFLKDAGVPNEPCVMKPNDTTIFSFPQKSEGINRKDMTAVDHLELWLDYQRYWCEHKPSVTISVKEDEWMEVGAWVYKNFDECTGVSFLPDDGGSYKQAPYEDCTETEYFAMCASMPNIDWESFQEFEDMVEGAQTLACTAGQCSI